MASVPHPELSETPRVAIYARVSTEDQAERQTVQGQLDFLRKLCDLHGWPIAGEYVDDGWSGTIPLAERPDGKRLLDDAADRRFGAVLLYRLDRLGRKTRVLLDAHETLEGQGVAIKSATEPFDTSTPIGTFVFQLLGSIAELERSTITERMTLGRDRVARGGKWLGVVPFGYDVDAEGYLVPSARLVPSLEITEAELITDVIARVEAGSTVTREAQRLNHLGVSPARRYPGGKVVRQAVQWSRARLAETLHNSVYRGVHVLNSRHGPVERAVPALVPTEVWERVQQRMQQNRSLSQKNAKYGYLVRGLVTCEDCGRHYSGSTSWMKRAAGRQQYHYYRCTSQLDGPRAGTRASCGGKMLPAAWLDNLVWEDCRRWIRNPGDTIADAQRELRARMEQTTGLQSQRRALQQQLGEKDTERERILTLYRRNRITVAEAEGQLDAIARETADLRQMLEGIGSQTALAAAYEAHLTEAASLLLRLQGRLEEVDQMNDWATKREIVEHLVAHIGVRTDAGPTRKRASLVIRYSFGEPHAVVTGSA